MQPYYESLFEDSWEVHGIEWIAVFAYFDETGTHDSALITAVAGYLFSKDGAKLFRRMCHENIDPLLPLDKHGQRVYHSTKCIGGFDQFATLTVTQRERIVDLLVETIKKSMMLGVVIAIENKDYEDAIADSSRTRELAGDKYSVCLTRCIENMAAWLNRKDIRRHRNT